MISEKELKGGWADEIFFPRGRTPPTFSGDQHRLIHYRIVAKSIVSLRS